MDVVIDSFKDMLVFHSMYKHKKINGIIGSVGVVLFAIIITAAAATASTILESGIINVRRAQVIPVKIQYVILLTGLLIQLNHHGCYLFSTLHYR